MFKLILSIAILLFSSEVLAQRPVPLYEVINDDNFSDFEKVQIDSLYNFYSQNIDPSYDLINGRAYFPYYFRSQSKPLLFYKQTHSSSIRLKGIRYNDVCLDYDTFTDDVIYIDSGRFCVYSPLMVALNKDNVDCFEFYNDTDTLFFKYFKKETYPTFNLSEGYYEVVSSNHSKYIIKHYAVIEDKVGIDEYNNLHAAYIDVGNGFKEITSRRKFIRMFGDQSDEVRRYIEDMEIKVPRANKEQITCVLKYYDNLKNQNN